MALPASIDWTWTYLDALPVKWQGGTGYCNRASLTYAMEMRAIILGYPPTQLSMLFGGWVDRYLPGLSRPANACLESLWPMIPYKGIDTTTQAYSDMTRAMMAARPSDAAFADAPNHVLTDLGSFNHDGTIADRKLKAQEAIAAGYPLLLFVPGHALCAWGYDDSGLIGLDSRSQNAFPFHLDWANCQPSGIVRGVTFANAVMGTPPTPLPKPFIVVSLPPPTGNSNMTTLASIVTTAQAALVYAQANGDKVTQAQKDALTANVAALTVDAVVPPSGPGDWIVPPDASGTDSKGGVWTLGAATQYGKQILLNGSSAAGGQGTTISYKSGQIKVQNSRGEWWLWGGGGWAKTAAP
jgi:hypothetical protein